MDTRDGRIYDAMKVAYLSKEDQQYMLEMKNGASVHQQKRGKVGRNDPCPCGSKKKFKKCCMFQITRKEG
jgi:uncharacterized protein YecA (UPF0149 family)